MDSRYRLKTALEHRNSGTFPIDFGATPVTGIHVLIVEKLRQHFGLEYKPIKVIEPYQMLGEVDDELIDILGIDVVGAFGKNNMFVATRVFFSKGIVDMLICMSFIEKCF